MTTCHKKICYDHIKMTFILFILSQNFVCLLFLCVVIKMLRQHWQTLTGWAEHLLDVHPPSQTCFFLSQYCSPPQCFSFSSVHKVFPSRVWLSVWREDTAFNSASQLFSMYIGKILENDGENKVEMLKSCTQVQFRCFWFFLFSPKIAHYNILVGNIILSPHYN